MSFKILFLLVIFNFSICATSKAQDDSKNVTITVSGSGNTVDDAKQAALRSAIEQAYGSFISTKTEVFNDRVVADQMASVSSGNIQSYKMLNESQLPNGTWGVTLKALVSIDKLTSFVESKGFAIEIKGGIFAINIKQQLLNESSEQKIVGELFGILHEALQISFDYVLKAGEPKSKDMGSNNWEIPVTVSAIANSNMDFSVGYLIKTLNAISLSENEIDRYNTLNKTVHEIHIKYQKKKFAFYLRSFKTLEILQMLAYQWTDYVSGFTFTKGMETHIGQGFYSWEKMIRLGKRDTTFVKYYSKPVKNYSITFANGRIRPFHGNPNKEVFSIDIPEKRDFNLKLNRKIVDRYDFFTKGDIAGQFTFKDEKTLTEINQMSGYSIKADGVRYPFKHGGIVVDEKDGHGLVVGYRSKGEWDGANETCETLELNGYSDWRLPTKDEGQILRINLGDPFLRLWCSNSRKDKAFALCDEHDARLICHNWTDKETNMNFFAVRNF